MKSRFSEIRKNLKRDYSGFAPTRIAILGDTPTQFLHQSLRGLAYDLRLNPAIFEADFDQITMQVFDESSTLYRFQPDCVLIFQATPPLQARFHQLSPESREEFADREVESLRQTLETLRGRTGASILVCNFPEVDDRVFGNLANKVRRSFPFQLRRLNCLLMELAEASKGVFVVDLSSLQNRLGRVNIHSTTTYVSTGAVFDLEFWPVMAESVLQVVQALRGAIIKAVVLDLDNTLWGGVVGDDGMENLQIGDLGIGKAFTEFQKWLLQLRQRGIILCVCSKNFEEVAKRVFERHPDMVLRLSDIAVFVANWDNKVDNIRHIQSVLNIGFDSMVYLDDNPFERDMVRQAIPGLNIPSMPEDPADYLSHLQSLNLFETSSVSTEDANRTRQYQVEAERASLQKSYATEAEFLESLCMVAVALPFDRFHVPRIAQLTQRSNQFNLRTVRYTEADVERLANDPGYLTLYFTLSDKLGDHGLVSVVILRREPHLLFVDTWLMSCRVLKRGMEKFVLGRMVDLARAQGCREIVGEYVPTEKNELVRNHYRDLGFTPREDRWVLNLDSPPDTHCFIQLKNP